MVDANGEVLEFNVFTATLGYSRRHVFIPTPGRTTDDLLACLLQTFRVLGGVPEELVTDNMSALVSLSGGRRRRVERAWRFADEAGFRLVLCAPRSPETKGKDESANVNVNPSFTDSTNAIAPIAPTHPRRFRQRQAPFPASRSGARSFVR